jgi:hypothetical protein
MRTFHTVGRAVAVLVLLLLLLPAALHAQVPQSISYQGVLTDASGQSLPDGSYKLAMHLYDAPTAGNLVWSDDNQSIQLLHGVFSTTLGGQGKQPLPPFDRTYWLGISVDGGSELLPRVQLTSVPYSFHAERADTAMHVADGVPAGTVMAFAGNAAKVPSGWMLCDGRALVSSQYPALFDAVGAAWGDGTDDADSATDFNLPDLRGMFLRGADTTGIDPDASTRYAARSGGATGGNVGSYQNDATRGLVVDDPFTFDQSVSFGSQLGPAAGADGSSTFTSTPGIENRPKNAAVNYIIKVR